MRSKVIIETLQQVIIIPPTVPFSLLFIASFFLPPSFFVFFFACILHVTRRRGEREIETLIPKELRHTHSKVQESSLATEAKHTTRRRDEPFSIFPAKFSSSGLKSHTRLLVRLSVHLPNVSTRKTLVRAKRESNPPPH